MAHLHFFQQISLGCIAGKSERFGLVRTSAITAFFKALPDARGTPPPRSLLSENAHPVKL